MKLLFSILLLTSVNSYAQSNINFRQKIILLDSSSIDFFNCDSVLFSNDNYKIWFKSKNLKKDGLIDFANFIRVSGLVQNIEIDLIQDTLLLIQNYKEPNYLLDTSEVKNENSILLMEYYRPVHRQKPVHAYTVRKPEYNSKIIDLKNNIVLKEGVYKTYIFEDSTNVICYSKLVVEDFEMRERVYQIGTDKSIGYFYYPLYIDDRIDHSISSGLIKRNLYNGLVKD